MTPELPTDAVPETDEVPESEAAPGTGVAEQQGGVAEQRRIEEEPVAAAAEVDREALEAERDFLLRSLDDLEAEREAGNLDDEQYRTLYDDYTARAAAAIRSLETGTEQRPPAAPRPPVRKRVLVVSALVGFAIVAAAVLVAQLGDRSPGGTATGNQQASAADRVAELRKDVEANPNEPGPHVQLAQALLTAGNPSEAIKEFDAAAKLDPEDAEASAYGGWVVFLASRAVADGLDATATADLLDGALRRLDAAVAAQPDYPDAHFFRGMVLLRGRNDPAAAIPELERYIALVPNGAQTESVKGLLEQAKAAVSSPPAGK